MSTPTPGAAPQMAAETPLERIGPEICAADAQFAIARICDSHPETERLFDELVARYNAHAQLSKECHFAQSKLSKLGRLIEFADEANEGASVMEVATSASFNEALALEALSQTESERDAALATCADLLAALEEVLIDFRKVVKHYSKSSSEPEEWSSYVAARAALAKAKAGAQ